LKFTPAFIHGLYHLLGVCAHIVLDEASKMYIIYYT